MANHILVIDDDLILAGVIAFSLECADFTVTTAHDGPTGIQLVEEVSPDLIIIDMMMPGMDGLETCRRIRAISPVPIILLKPLGIGEFRDTSCNPEDVITKPFGERKLITRVRAVLEGAGRSSAA